MGSQKYSCMQEVNVEPIKKGEDAAYLPLRELRMHMNRFTKESFPISKDPARNFELTKANFSLD